MRTRLASIDDADAMSLVLREIIAVTGRERPNDTAFVIGQYIANPASIRCTVAVDENGILAGFQSLIRAEPGNRYDLPDGWAIIGTHISPRIHRRGVGSALFASSREAALQAGVGSIDACIGASNSVGLGYYEAMGFRTYREGDGVLQKVYAVEGDRAASV